jgi:hypothetical protein
VGETGRAKTTQAAKFVEPLATSNHIEGANSSNNNNKIPLKISFFHYQREELELKSLDLSNHLLTNKNNKTVKYINIKIYLCQMIKKA